MVAVGDPVSTGLVANLAQPESNLTGLTTLLPASMANRLHLLHTVVPGLVRVAVLWQPDNPANRLAWQETQSAVWAAGLTLLSHPVRTPDDIEAAFAAMARQGADGLLTCEDALTVAQRRPIVTLAAAHRLPAVYPQREFVEAGGLMADGPNFPAPDRRAAAYVDRLLRGATPVDRAIEQPWQYAFVFQRQTARALGLTLPSSLREQADAVFGRPLSQGYHVGGLRGARQPVPPGGAFDCAHGGCQVWGDMPSDGTGCPTTRPPAEFCPPRGTITWPWCPPEASTLTHPQTARSLHHAVVM
jgi:ABC-type uncharacterized transport system substrate-binding protein